MKAVALGLLAGLACAACAGSSRTTAPTATGASSEPIAMPRTDDSRAEIERLDGEIASARASLTLAPPTAAEITAAHAAPMTDVASCDSGLPPAATPRCTDSCTLSGQICDNAASICRIADQLAPDPWASDKCDGAKASCELAHAQCCACR